MCNPIKKILDFFKKEKKKPEYIDPNYFLDVDDETLDFLEKDSEQCISSLEIINLRLKTNAFQLLSILIVGIGSSFILLTQMKSITYLTVGLAVFIIMWTACAIYLSIGCLSTSSRALSSTKADSLYVEGYKNISDILYNGLISLGYRESKKPLPLIRRFRLASLSETIDNLFYLNKKLSFRYNLAIQIMVVCPLLALICSIISFYLA